MTKAELDVLKRIDASDCLRLNWPRPGDYTYWNKKDRPGAREKRVPTVTALIDQDLISIGSGQFEVGFVLSRAGVDALKKASS